MYTTHLHQLFWWHDNFQSRQKMLISFKSKAITIQNGFEVFIELHLKFNTTGLLQHLLFYVESVGKILVKYYAWRNRKFILTELKSDFTPLWPMVNLGLSKYNWIKNHRLKKNWFPFSKIVKYPWSKNYPSYRILRTLKFTDRF